MTTIDDTDRSASSASNSSTEMATSELKPTRIPGA